MRALLGNDERPKIKDIRNECRERIQRKPPSDPKRKKNPGEPGSKDTREEVNEKSVWPHVRLCFSKIVNISHYCLFLLSSMGAEEAPLSTFGWFLHLFFSRKFIVHRLTGLVYLILYALTFVYYFVDYEGFKDSAIIWVLPSVGLFQSITAIYTFTFLPKSTKDGGYFGDKGILSYNFIVENSFFELILLFQWIYYSEVIYGILRSTVIIENFFVFLPYIIRGLWPKTSIRDALDNPKNKSAKNFNFFMIATWITKIFYLWAKHYIGYFLNYVRYLDRVSEEEKYHIYLLLIFSAFATTISMFLHTLKFKHYLDPKLSFLIYQASYFATFYSFYQISGIFLANLDLTLLTLVGLLLNFSDIKYQNAYQFLVMAILNAARYGFLPPLQTIF